jgi:hypothetical protein
MNESGRIPAYIARSDVPIYFPHFPTKKTLDNLAHTGRGPKYVISGRRAYYEPGDIIEWLEQHKKTGPKRDTAVSMPSNVTISKPRKLGRPTKYEQMKRRQAEAQHAGL